MTTTEAPAAPTETDRSLNVGVEVETKHIGTVRIKELALEQVVELLSDIVLVFSTFAKGEDELKELNEKNPAAGLGWMAKVAQDPATLHAMKKLMAASTAKTSEDFDGMPITDWLKLIVALKQVMDWEELKELFFQIVPPSALAGLKKGTPQAPKA
ncbi:MAG: hypothetical protein V3T31_02130 [candidate division Zixibacteria bacterium]